MIQFLPTDGSYSIVLRAVGEDGQTTRVKNWTPTGSRPAKVTADLHSIVAWQPQDGKTLRPITFDGPGTAPDGILQPNQTVIGSKQTEFTRGHFPSLANFCESVFALLEERWVSAHSMVVRTSPGVRIKEIVADKPPERAA